MAAEEHVDRKLEDLAREGPGSFPVTPRFLSWAERGEVDWGGLIRGALGVRIEEGEGRVVSSASSGGCVQPGGNGKEEIKGESRDGLTAVPGP